MMTMNTAQAEAKRAFDAGFVANEMAVKERYAFVTGVLTGLSYARFQKDRPDESGMNCVQGWLYTDSKARWTKLLATFKRYEDKAPAVLIYLLVKKECGE